MRENPEQMNAKEVFERAKELATSNIPETMFSNEFGTVYIFSVSDRESRMYRLIYGIPDEVEAYAIRIPFAKDPMDIGVYRDEKGGFHVTPQNGEQVDLEGMFDSLTSEVVPNRERKDFLSTLHELSNLRCVYGLSYLNGETVKSVVTYRQVYMDGDLDHTERQDVYLLSITCKDGQIRTAVISPEGKLLEKVYLPDDVYTTDLTMPEVEELMNNLRYKPKKLMDEAKDEQGKEENVLVLKEDASPREIFELLQGALSERTMFSSEYGAVEIYQVYNKEIETFGLTSTCEVVVFQADYADPPFTFCSYKDERGEFGIKFVKGNSSINITLSNTVTPRIGDDEILGQERIAKELRQVPLLQPAPSGEVIGLSWINGKTVRCDIRKLHDVNSSQDVYQIFFNGPEGIKIAFFTENGAMRKHVRYEAAGDIYIGKSNLSMAGASQLLGNFYYRPEGANDHVADLGEVSPNFSEGDRVTPYFSDSRRFRSRIWRLLGKFFE